MNLYRIVEIWDNILFCLIDVFASILFLKEPRIIKKVIKKNKKLKNKHEGGRCFIVMNGPSINNHDLSKLKDEIVFASNFFFRAPLCKTVVPDYYCWLDKNAFLKDDADRTLSEFREACPNTELLVSSMVYEKYGEMDKTNYVYVKPLANFTRLHLNLDRMMTHFVNVVFFAIASAMYMGFKDIYILGLDFEPGVFKHFTNLGVNCADPTTKQSRQDVCELHWGYVKAHQEAYIIEDYARKHGVNIINLNPNSNIRAFRFGNYESVI